MNDDEVDDIAFLTGDSRVGMSKRVLYEPSGVADRVRRIVLTPKKACCVAVACFFAILSIALIAAFARPYLNCDCGVEKDQSTSDYNSQHFSYGHSTTPGYPNPLTTTQETATNGEIFPWKELRLPQFVQPYHYSLFMHPNLTTFAFKGAINITFSVTLPQNFIVLHGKNLDVLTVTLQDSINNSVTKWLIYEKHEQIYVEFNGGLTPGKMYVVNILFNGTLAERLEGFYLSSYINAAGIRRYLVTTHFEPTYARMAFPCFDEPAVKATFTMSIVRDADHISLFNSPLNQTVNLKDNLLLDIYQKTVKMSTYLVAFVVCDYKNVSKMADNQVKVSVFAPPDQIEQANLALDVAVGVLNYYNNFFGIAYPLPKQDLISIPDFGAGAMENWGLTMYRDTILADINESSDIQQQALTVTIAHELAHQWFGNLVTMKWWNDLWLNEGFASYMENLGTEHIYPDWKMMEQFILEKTQPALKLDALPSSHPISVKVGDPAEIESIFDSISYSKGAAIINMVEEFLGMETLQGGLKTYLSKFKYSNAETEDLWQVLSQQSQLMNLSSVNVKEVMDTWTQQMGFPLIKIHRNNNEIKATQQRFLVGGRVEDDVVSSEYISKYGYKWNVPLTFITDQQQSESTLIWMKLNDVTFTVPDNVKWIKFNVNQTGFYRVTYDNQMWLEIIDALKKNHTMFSPADRSSLIDDVFTLSLNQLLDPQISLQLIQYLVNERDYVPWITALDHLATMETMLWEKQSYRLLVKYIQSLLVPITDYLGWEEKGSHLERFLRPNILLESLHHKNESIVLEARKRFDDWKTKNASIPPALREVVYTAGIKYGSYDDWKHCWDVYTTTQLTSEISILQTALGASQDPWILSQYLEYSLQRDKVRPQNTYIVLRSVYWNPIGRDMTWRFVKSNWEKLVEMFGIGSFTMANIISDMTSRFNTRFDYLDVKSFFESHDTGSGKRAVKTSLEKISSHCDWLEKNEKLVEDWLRKNVKE
ncbi:hypothetical protein CHUAL_010702 [Chamberlinius hualienensis]